MSVETLRDIKIKGTSLSVHWLRLHLPMQEVWVQSLVEELRSHMTQGQKKQNVKQTQYCNKFNKDLDKKVYVAHRAPLPMGCFRQEYWSGMPFAPPGDLPNPGTEPASLALAGRFFTTESPGKPSHLYSF